MERLYLASENYAGVHPAVMQAIHEANVGYAPSYGQDEETRQATQLLQQAFGVDIDVHFVFNGTGANNFALGSVSQRWQSIFCTDVAHLYVDESTAPETFTGCRLYPVKSSNGKMLPASLEAVVGRQGDLHHPQPGVVSITQPTEYGTVYTSAELKAIKAICTKHGLLLHLDGARYFNAAAALSLPLGEMATVHGVDVLTLGGTKAGMLFGEAVVFFNAAHKAERRYHLKRSMQLASKQRFIAAQFTALLTNNLWKNIGEHTNQLAKAFEKQVAGLPGLQFTRPVETNMVFLRMDQQLYLELQPKACFYYWNERAQEVRLVFSFAHTLADVIALAALFKEKLA